MSGIPFKVTGEMQGKESRGTMRLGRNREQEKIQRAQKAHKRIFRRIAKKGGIQLSPTIPHFMRGG